MNPSHVCTKSWGYTTIQSSSEPKEPLEINMNLSKEGSKYIPGDMEHYKIHAKDTHFSLMSVRAGYQQQLSLRNVSSYVSIYFEDVQCQEPEYEHFRH